MPEHPRPPPDGTDEADRSLDDPSLYLNRELSMLEFQRRVLHEALDERTPLLERARFLGLFTKNVDEFFMKRVGGLKQQIDAGVTERTVDGRTPEEQWAAALETARPMFERQSSCWRETVRPALADAGVYVHDYADLTDDQRAEVREYFERNVLPTLTPLSFDPAHPFPFISNLSLSLGVLVRREGGDDDRDVTFTRVKIPQNRPRLVELEAEQHPDATVEYVRLEAVIRENLDLLIPNVEVVDAALFRLTRNAEVRRDEEVAEDLIDMIESVIEQRRFATAVRLEVEAEMPDRMLDVLTEQLDVHEREVFRREGPLDFKHLMGLTDLDRPDLKLRPWTPRPHPRLETDGMAELDGDADVFSAVREGDILLHHPYHSFTDTVQRFLAEAASDPDVLAIKAAIYRTASDSKVIQSLIDAADNGKQVAVMVELKARFDEQNNLEWVRRLEEEGIHVAYGTVGLKTHTKTALVVREEESGVELYSHVATGNYHSETAKGYVDLGLLTADRDIGQDLVKVFNFFTGPSLDERFRKLLIAPVAMRERFVEMIRREADHARAGRRARIVAKVNALEDPGIVRELYAAARAGVDIDLIVRDICRLRPGIEGLSENVTVRSVVGRFLEHSRIVYVENGGDPEYYLGSADWMTRNLDNRVEAIAPVEDPTIREQLRFVLEVMLADNRRAWEMDADGSYEQCRPGDDPTYDTQAILMEQTRRAAEREDGGRGLVVEHPAATGELLVEPVDDAVDDGVRRDGAGSDDPDGGPAETAAADDLPRALHAHPDRWYVPDSERYEFAVRTPEGGRAYRVTPDAAADLVERYYG
ncbi:MAG: polyphosphate kinase 1 [Haloferacaceae archaeon]